MTYNCTYFLIHCRSLSVSVLRIFTFSVFVAMLPLTSEILLYICFLLFLVLFFGPSYGLLDYFLGFRLDIFRLIILGYICVPILVVSLGIKVSICDFQQLTVLFYHFERGVETFFPFRFLCSPHF